MKKFLRWIGFRYDNKNYTWVQFRILPKVWIRISIQFSRTPVGIEEE